MPETVQLEYAYSPADFFESRTSVTLPDGVASFDGGQAIITLAQFERPLGESV